MISIFLGALVFAACSSLVMSPTLVKVGDTSSEVKSLMGAPIMRQFQGPDEAWHYKRTKSNYTGDEYQVIWFHQGIVTAITTYTNAEELQSDRANFMSIRWRDAPPPPQETESH